MENIWTGVLFSMKGKEFSMERMNIGQLQVRSRFSFLTIKNCYIKEKFGEHGKARITGEIKGREYGKY